jgi:hypothetical protein
MITLTVLSKYSPKLFKLKSEIPILPSYDKLKETLITAHILKQADYHLGYTSILRTGKGVAKGGAGGPGPPQNPSGPPQNKSKTH